MMLGWVIVAPFLVVLFILSAPGMALFIWLIGLRRSR